jgi:hypothetical protein
LSALKLSGVNGLCANKELITEILELSGIHFSHVSLGNRDKNDPILKA